ncbi:hypothetical protein D3C73_1147280 [compost metagenome]
MVADNECLGGRVFIQYVQLQAVVAFRCHHEQVGFPVFCRRQKDLADVVAAGIRDWLGDGIRADTHPVIAFRHGPASGKTRLRIDDCFIVIKYQHGDVAGSGTDDRDVLAVVRDVLHPAVIRAAARCRRAPCHA